VIGLSKQAVHQQHKQKQLFYKQLGDLIIQMDILRSEHPGCGLAKAYDTLQPTLLGRDRFVAIFMDLGYGLKPVKNAIRTTIPGYYRCQNLIEGMVVTEANQVVQSDITYILVGGDYYYAVFIIDVYTKRIVGYQVSDHMRAQANMKALKQLIRLRGETAMQGLIHHSDRGSQYGSDLYRNLLNKMNCHISMDQSAQKNAYAERVNGIIKNEYLAYWSIKNLQALKKAVKRAIQHYNDKRIHRSLPGKRSPIQFEEDWQKDRELRQHKELIYSAENYVKNKNRKRFLKQIDQENGYFCPLSYQYLIH